MKIFKSILPLAIVAGILSSCAISAPLLVTDNANQKQGTAEYKVILGFIRPMHADVSIEKAAKNGGITKVSSVDVVIKGGLFTTTYQTIVTGE